VFFNCGDERANCFARVRESKGFSIRAKRGGKAPGDVIADKRTRGPARNRKAFAISVKIGYSIKINIWN